MSGFGHTGGSAPIDNSSKAVKIITHGHHEIHEGNNYSVCDAVTLANINDTRDILIVTPNSSVEAHLVFEVRASKETNVVLYEGTTTSADGTGLTEVNRNRNSAKTATVVVTHTPTVDTTGNQLCIRHFGSGQKSGGESRDVNEWILKTNTKYLLRTTTEAAANDISTDLNWYEVG